MGLLAQVQVDLGKCIDAGKGIEVCGGEGVTHMGGVTTPGA